MPKVAAQKRAIKQQRAVRTREEILEAAVRLFARRGFLATTMAELAKSIRMTPGALYWHFPTKEDLLLAAIEEISARYQREYADFVTHYRTFSAREQMQQVIERTRSFLRHHREYGQFFAILGAEAAETNERVANALRDALDVYVMGLASILRYGMEKTHELRADVAPELLAHMFVAAQFGIMSHQNLFRETLSYDGVVSALDKFFVAGMTPVRPGEPA